MLLGVSGHGKREPSLRESPVWFVLCGVVKECSLVKLNLRARHLSLLFSFSLRSTKFTRNLWMIYFRLRVYVCIILFKRIILTR